MGHILDDTAGRRMESRGDSDGDSGDSFGEDFDFGPPGSTASHDRGNDDADRRGCAPDCTQAEVYPVRNTRNGDIVGGTAKPLSGPGGGCDVPDCVATLLKLLVAIVVLVAVYWALKRFNVFFSE